MTMRSVYPTQRTYSEFVHRELSMAWLTLATVLSGRHRLEPDVLLSPFGCLEFGCGQGLNLLFNAAAHPQARFYGVDLNASHIAEATARAESLGLTNVSFAQADLSWWADGLPDRSPMRGWPERYEFVIAHGVASWVGEQVRQALIAAAGELLRPGGLFFCSYNTLPGWLARSTLQMLSQIGRAHV